MLRKLWIVSGKISKVFGRVVPDGSLPMNPSRLQWPTVRRLCLGVVAAFTLPVIGQQPGPDRTKKEVIEPPVVKVVTDSAPATPPGGDPGKRKIEFPAKRVVAGTQPSDATAQPRSETENPTVKPGD